VRPQLEPLIPILDTTRQRQWPVTDYSTYRCWKLPSSSRDLGTDRRKTLQHPRHIRRPAETRIELAEDSDTIVVFNSDTKAPATAEGHRTKEKNSGHTKRTQKPNNRENCSYDPKPKRTTMQLPRRIVCFYISSLTLKVCVYYCRTLGPVRNPVLSHRVGPVRNPVL